MIILKARGLFQCSPPTQGCLYSPLSRPHHTYNPIKLANNSVSSSANICSICVGVRKQFENFPHGDSVPLIQLN